MGLPHAPRIPCTEWLVHEPEALQQGADIMTVTNDTRSPAEIYDAQFVPALFAQWAPVVLDAAAVRENDRVLDVACGTGALTLAAAERVGRGGSVVGLDANPDMLTVARRKSAQVEWMEGKAEALPLPDKRFDAVVSQFGFMFFDHKPQALREMMRVLRPGGRLSVAVCDAVDHSPGYGAFAQLLDRLFGSDVGNAFRAPFALGDPTRLASICREAGIGDARVTEHHRDVCFDSIDALVSTERACVWTLGGILDDEQFARLLEESKTALKPFMTGGKAIQFDMPSLIVTAQKH
jgi:ubiquinone/menaquinone biosynthesis C-methylase UbiE